MNSLTETALKELPSGKFVRFDKVQDMDDGLREVVVWRWFDVNIRKNVVSYFDVETGEYIAEARG